MSSFRPTVAVVVVVVKLYPVFTVEIAGSRLSQLLVRPSYCIDM